MEPCNFNLMRAMSTNQAHLLVSYLDLPDLAALAQASPVLASLASDPLLHRTRVRVTAPSRVKHALFGANLHGVAFRPTVGELVHRGVMRGFAIERRWRMGAYFYTRNSIVQYENGLRLARRHASDVISVQLRRRSTTRGKFLDSISHVLPDVESASHTISRILLPAIHQLKWSLQRDRLAKMVRLGSCATGSATFGDWRERKGHNIIEDGERVRLAICPDVRKTVRLYEELARSTPLHLIVDSPSESRSTSPLYSSDSGSRGNLYDSVIPPAPADLQTSTLTRHGTLLSTNAAPGRNAAELNSILGDSTSRLRPGASVLPVLGHPQPGEGTSLEQAKSRARVEVDIILDSNTCVQGGYLQGHVKINIRECARNEVQVMISGGKVRVIGFESISNERDRYPFYQCSSPLLTITATSDGHSAHDSYQDSEGFAQAIEGEHTIPFSMYLPISANYGVPKGSIKVQAGVAVRYIAMVSIKVKDPISDSRSIAHFYRDCEIWPRLNPSIMLAPAGIPLRAKTSDSRLPGSRRIDLTASIHRLHWIAGQQCFVKVFVANDSKKRIKSLAFALIRTTIVCKPEHHAGTLGCDHTLNYDACQTSTTQKQVAESVLELGRRGARGHASAKGWWVGVAPGEQLEFSHSITLPSDALSVIRSRLLEVDYSVKVTLSAGGALRATDIQVSLPIQIINFLSIDPPPSYPLPELHLNPPLTILDSPNGPSLDRTNKMRLTETYNPYGSHATVLESLAEVDEERLPTPGQELNISAEDHALEDAYGGIDYDSDDDVLPDEQEPSYLDSRDDLQGLTAYEDDADEVVPHILQVDPEFENAPRFSDLYYASVEEDLCLSSGSGAMEAHQNHSMTCSSQYQLGLVRRVQEYNMLQSELRPNSRPPSNWRPNPPKGSSSFQDRVQAKLTAAAVRKGRNVKIRTTLMTTLLL
ncbi:hypothetical protein DXG01_009940 [Tephrocybe rancida]|nr:hypothetical protein DXG01_009940 [Tephrocybe rancida]